MHTHATPLLYTHATPLPYILNSYHPPPVHPLCKSQFDFYFSAAAERRNKTGESLTSSDESLIKDEVAKLRDKYSNQLKETVRVKTEVSPKLLHYVRLLVSCRALCFKHKPSPFRILS